MKTGLAPLVLVVALGLSGCGGASTETAPSSQGAGQTNGAAATQAGSATVIDTVPDRTAAAPAVDGPVVSAYGLAGKSVVEIVEGLDETNSHRGSGVNGSVRFDHLLLTDEKSGQEQQVPVPDDLFYLSVAPYAGTTHECFNHSLTGCVGEFAGASMQATVTKKDGTVLYDGPVTTFENGFVGFWLPRDIEGTLSFSYDGKSVEGPFATDAESPTCLTTLQLT